MPHSKRPSAHDAGRAGRRFAALLGAALAVAAAVPAGSTNAAPGAAAQRVLHVGPGRALARPSDAARVARDGDVVEIDAGVYDNDHARWPQSDLVLRAVGGRAHLASHGLIPNDKAIWILRGDNVTVEGIEFSGARSRARIGAGIRHEGGRLAIRDSYFHDNEMGILMGVLPTADILIERSEFARHVDPTGWTHAIYIGRVRSLTLRYSYVHATDEGHHVKSRAAVTYILYNRLSDEADGTASYEIDLPNCGLAYVIGNVLHKGPHADNTPAVAYGAEGCEDRAKGLFVVNNTLLNDMPGAMLLRNFTRSPARLINNLVVGAERLAEGPHVAGGGNILAPTWRFTGADRYDPRLPPGSPAVDAGVDPGFAGGVALRPAFEYVHPLSGRERVDRGRPDVGAYALDPHRGPATGQGPAGTPN